MLKNILSILLLTGAVFTPNLTAWAQEIEMVATSSITEAKLPTGAGKLVQGEAEVLAWAGANYRKADAAHLISQLRSGLQATGWTYEPGGEKGNVTVFSVLKEGAPRRIVLGFFVPTDDALVVAWTEVLPVGGSTNSADNRPKIERTEFSTASTSASSRKLHAVRQLLV